jgi:RHH-type rel operon transcriptional repressor/antitoxin RelB
MKMSTAVSIKMPDELVRELDSFAKTTKRSRSFHIQKALEAYLEEKAELPIAIDRLQDTSDPIISIDEMRESGQDLFGKYCSGHGNLSADRKTLLKDKIKAKN